MSSVSQWFADNQSNWNDRAAQHEAAGYGIAELVANPDAVSSELAPDLPRFGSLTGRDVLHLQCHLGTDTVGFARRGARRVVGLDLSDESLRRAEQITRACGVQVEYVQANVYDAREAVRGQFDLVYTSLGVLCWLPDVDRWAQVVASLLRPGGQFFIRDDHPMFMTVGEDVSQGLKIELPYFQREQPCTWESEYSYMPVPEGTPPLTHRRNHQWNHSLSEIVTALIRAGLVIDVLEESTWSHWCPWPELMVREADGRWRLRDNPDRLPLEFVIEAHR
ncbi:class I SAM-dependent methyltransferase [Scrofimicrobium sp. R131]|uniref:Class I SAM-dependent methyltransferase n=1 Tax=Scrofimicrobium appendicitidis TaxID=3079930 RepID=A0AAU7V7A9_9ACTO